jgi:hypothetical protein
MRARRMVVGLVVAATAVGGCTGDDDANGQPDGDASTMPEPTATTLVSTDAVLPYFEAFTSSDRDAMFDHAAEGSDAEMYARIQEEARSVEQTLEVTDTELDVCSADQPDDCATVSDFQVDDAGQLVTFSINGNPLADRIVGPGEVADSGVGVTAQTVVAYHTALGALTVIADVTNSTEVDARPHFSLDVSYVGADGRQAEQIHSSGPLEVEPGATASYWVSFDDAEPGGTIRLEGSLDEDGDLTPFELVIPVPAAG